MLASIGWIGKMMRVEWSLRVSQRECGCLIDDLFAATRVLMLTDDLFDLREWGGEEIVSSSISTRVLILVDALVDFREGGR